MNILVDSCFWFAYWETRQKDQYMESAKRIYDICFDKYQYNIIIPFPSLYETVNTKLLRDKNKTMADWFLKKLASDTKYLKVFDDKYREAALAETTKNPRRISLVDSILRLMMQDSELHIRALITFNTGDFVDICKQYNIEIINEYTQFQ